jgi:hypothetical protein
MQTTLGILFGIFTCWESSEQLLDVIENFVVTRSIKLQLRYMKPLSPDWSYKLKAV